MKNRLLVVEDEQTLLETLAYNFRRQEYEVYTAIDGLEALEKARQLRPDLIILDVMLPHLDGFEVCRVLRQETSVPILMLTARTDEIDRVIGLEVGADDYLVKPFSMRELIARVKALLRRVRMDQEDKTEGTKGEARLIFDDLIIDPKRHEVICRGESLDLTPREFELLLFLAHNRGIVLSRALILERVWGWDYDGGSRTVNVHIRWLREKIEEDPSHPKRIVTVRGVGYRFEG